jgi:hypothetical protein
VDSLELLYNTFKWIVTLSKTDFIYYCIAIWFRTDVSSSYFVIALGEASVNNPSMQYFQLNVKPFSYPGRLNLYIIALQCDFIYSDTDILSS